MSRGEVSLRRIIPKAKCFHGEVSSYRNFFAAKCLYGELSVRWNVLRRNVLRRNVLRRNVLRQKVRSRFRQFTCHHLILEKASDGCSWNDLQEKVSESRRVFIMWAFCKPWLLRAFSIPSWCRESVSQNREEVSDGIWVNTDFVHRQLSRSARTTTFAARVLQPNTWESLEPR